MSRSHYRATDGLYRQAWRDALFGLIVNLFLAATKLVGGIVGHSFALVSDAINSLGRALNLERRDNRRERRVGKVAQYTGPARRKIIDRRKIQGDRRG